MSPWTSQQYPPLAAWVADNQAPLDLLVAASNRPQFYSPWPALLHGEPSLGAGLPLDAIQVYREIARALPVRAMWHAGEGRPLEAWHDLLALHRLASFCAGQTFVEYLVAIAMSDIACHDTVTFLCNPNLSADEARQILHDLTALPPFPPMADCVDHGERIVSLGMILEVATSGGGFTMLDDSPASSNLLNHVTVDWNIVLTEMNYWFDQLTAALQIADPVARSAAVNAVFANIQTAQADAWAGSRLMSSVISCRQRGRLVATSAVNFVTPALQSMIAADNRANTMRDLTRLAAALAVYRAEHAGYPEKLSHLVPEILATLPVDSYHGKPYSYTRTSDGYLLFSLGENGTDDGGSNEQQSIFEGNELNHGESHASDTQPNIPTGADDISIRVPQPPAKPPQALPAQ